MRITTYGTRGSTPVSRPDTVRFGGNTTCLRIESECLPPGVAFVVDTGSGYFPLSQQLLKEGIMNVAVVYTHYHHDHTQGLLLAPHTYIPKANVEVWGPSEHGEGPREVMQDIMRAPHFPVDFKKVAHRFKCHGLQHIGTQVLVIHPVGGFTLMKVDTFERALAEGKQLPLKNGKFPMWDCLVVRMHKTTHPEYTVSYRFEERTTGRIFVFLTDHENTDGYPTDLKNHISGANLLIQDGQYSQKKYQEQTAGYGHGTPEYCARTAITCGVKKLGITHHDPMASDEDVDARVNEARAFAAANEGWESAEQIFACADYQQTEV